MRHLLVACLLFSTQASATLIGEKDWITYDEWSMGHTNATGAEIAAVFDSATGRCYVASCVVGHLDLTGYTWASTEDVNTLFQTFGFQLPSMTAESVTPLFGDDSIRNLQSVIGAGAAGHVGVNGWPSTWTRIVARTRTQSSPDTRDILYLYDFTGCGGVCNDYFGLSRSVIDTEMWFQPPILDMGLARINGGWFYKSVGVPEPGTLLLLSGALAGLALTRRRAKQGETEQRRTTQARSVDGGAPGRT